MFRCLELAASGKGNVAPNPMVGSVLVHNNTIIGEGYHQQYGQAHAEVNCINSVLEADKYLISKSTLYVSLEPCSHFGKTPPCSNLIIASGIKKVVVGCRDSYVEVNGKGIEKLRQNGIDVTVGVLEDDCKNLNKRFFTFHIQKRPYIILKWAETANSKIAGNTNERLLISNDFSNRLVHKWRHEEAAILVGTNT
ncbi:MAG: bifunctional diaminohydroxyphosphoribosylaminopyrimidine deaminase/5-amino-6-(5-phosphoribosylamino)uracil reductase RibD, partial [Deinococcales bacterium]|nr:bifunctional diaminohydroxyphosphoribosylaminopyrimidine deaminase/5-amino-6-(5-phosphoribosylamino)uracil reductase RibD [Chitinophagaceae bacterium]